MFHVFRAVALALACALVTQIAVADPAPLKQTILPYKLYSGELRNSAAVETEVFSEIVDAGAVPWLRLTFSQVVLAPGSRLEIRSLQDGAVQTLNATTLAQWGSTSAYFNGSAVSLSLIAAPGGGRNLVQVDRILVGAAPAEDRSQCGPTDDRVPSSEPARARLLDIGCTASIYNSQSCFITAGHCLSSPAFVDVVEFNVPPSLSNGSLQHPPPEHQYAVTNERQYVNGGVGNDWGLFKVFQNSQTGLMPFEAQGAALAISQVLPASGDTVRIVGYGVDGGTANQTQQVSNGPTTTVGTSRMDYRSDTEGGNSGSAVTLPGNDAIVAVHTHGGCNTGGGGANSGTSITQSGLQSALASFCATGSGGVSCADIDRLFARCNANRRLQVLVRLTDDSHVGETVTIAADGDPQDLTVSVIGGTAAFWSAPFASGAHTVSLLEPAGCAVPDVTVTCPAPLPLP